MLNVNVMNEKEIVMSFLTEIVKKSYKHLANKFYKSRALNFDVLGSFFIIQILTAVSIISYTYMKNSDVLVDFSNRIVENISSSEVALISNRFNTAMHSTELGSYLMHDVSSVDVKNKDIIHFMMGHMTQFKFAEAIFVCTESNYFLLVMRVKKDATYVTNETKLLPRKAAFILRVIDGTSSKPKEFWHYLDEDGKKLVEEIIPESQITFVPKNRMWYQKAQQMRANIWTDVYIGNPGKSTLVACAVPLFSHKGEFTGVVASSINLAKLSNEPFFNSGISMIINEKREIIAHPNEKNIGKNLNGEPRLITIDELNDKIVTEAFRIQSQQTEKERFIFESIKNTYIALLKKLQNYGFANWSYLMITPIDNFIGGVKITQRNSLLICLTILILAIFIIAFLSKRISKPIHNLSEQADRITNFDLSTADEIKSGIKEIQKLQDSISRMRKSLISFSKFVPKNLVKKLLDKGTEVKIGGSKKQLTIFFSHVANFTSLSEEYPAEKLVTHLSEYFEEMTEILKQNDATIDKYIDDTVMAFWGAPHADANHSVHCCVSALLCQRRLLDLNRKWEYEKKPQLLTRIGIHTGEVIVGNIGSSERMNYTILGDSVNLAARLEGTNKLYGTNIIVSDATVKHLHDHAVVRPLDIVAVKGKQEGVAIYELVALKNADPLVLPSDNQVKFCGEFTKGFRFYLEQRWDEAINIFQNLQLDYGRDVPCEMYIKRCEEYKKTPPPKDWDGVYHLESK